MSHIVEIQTEIRDFEAIRAACQRLGLKEPVQGEAKLFRQNNVKGAVVQLPDWKYPIVADLETGSIKYDNFKGVWGAESHLNQFRQAYAVEKAKIEARRQGHSVHETLQQDGSIRLTINAEGGYR